MFAALLGFVGAALAGEVRVDVIDVGQGDAILIRTPANKTILIDAGDRGSNMLAQLAKLGVDHLDLAIASHPHADHVGQMAAVVNAFPPKVYVDNGMPHTTQTYEDLMRAVEANPAIGYREGKRGTVFNLDDGAKLEVLLPGDTRFSNTRSDLNSNSVVTRLTHGDDCFLFPGDGEEPTERALLDMDVGECDVLKVAHHGSNHSSVSAFLSALKPSIAVISVGIGNRYGHPGEEAMSRLGATGATIYRTDRDGTVSLFSTGGGIRVETEKSEGEQAANVPAAGMPEPEKALPAAPEAANTPTAQDEACPFPASKKSEVFHEAGCGNAAKISSGNLVCFPSKEEAEKSGKHSAGCCHP
ncbi:MAG: MBL fold metallo-hydrolase [Deltaproteobacteria bacterium]|nr:MBL fold metallo-hydrolase [Deltaproteobacteria bacterium]